MNTNRTSITLPSNNTLPAPALARCLITWPAYCTLRMTWTCYSWHKSQHNSQY